MKRRKFLRNTGIAMGAATVAGYAGWQAIDSKISVAEDHSLLIPDSKKWSNWSGNQICEPKEFFLPHSEDEIITKLKTSVNKIRVVGGGHSFSPIVPSNDILSSLKNIKGIVSHDPKTNIAVINAGSHLYDLTEDMHLLGYAFPNQGDINRQSLGGAVSTSTHGTGEKLTSFAGNIIGFRLITSGGEVIECSNEQNSELYYGGVVSVGALGFVTQYTVQLLPKYKLKEKVYPAKTTDLLDNFDKLTKENRNFEFWPFFYIDMSLVKTLNLTDEAITKESTPLLNDDFLMGLALTLSRNTSESIEKIQSMMAPLMDSSEKINDSYKIYPSARNLKFNEMEYEVPRNLGVECLQEIISTVRKNKIPMMFPMEVRTVKSDDFWMSPFYGRDTIAISIHHFNKDDYNLYFPIIEAVFKKYQGRPHWGKLSYVNQDYIRQVYPKYDDFVKLRNQLDPKHRFSNDFITKIFG